jgi:hypothetical protein
MALKMRVGFPRSGRPSVLFLATAIIYLRIIARDTNPVTFKVILKVVSSFLIQSQRGEGYILQKENWQ